MTPTAPRLNRNDPRIVSPQIKVIFPSQNTEKDLKIAEEHPKNTAQIPQTLPTASEPQITETKESTVVGTVKPEQTTSIATPEPTVTKKASSWIDTLKDHAGLFIAVALISVGIGILIGKKS